MLPQDSVGPEWDHGRSELSRLAVRSKGDVLTLLERERHKSKCAKHSEMPHSTQIGEAPELICNISLGPTTYPLTDPRSKARP